MLHGLRDRVLAETVDLPDERAGRKVVTSNRETAQNDLTPPVVLGDVRRGPVVPLRARDPPDFTAGCGIQHDEKAVVEMIVVEQQPVVVTG